MPQSLEYRRKKLLDLLGVEISSLSADELTNPPQRIRDLYAELDRIDKVDSSARSNASGLVIDNDGFRMPFKRDAFNQWNSIRPRVNRTPTLGALMTDTGGAVSAKSVMSEIDEIRAAVAQSLSLIRAGVQTIQKLLEDLGAIEAGILDAKPQRSEEASPGRLLDI